MDNTDFLRQAEENVKKAQTVIEAGGFAQAWKSIGAEINLVGSLPIGVLAKHRDIDFHIYTAMLDIKQDFEVIAQIAAHPAVKRVNFVNLSHTDECCLEWHLWFEDKDGELWQIDMIHIQKESRYDGYFEKTAQDIKHAMTEDMRKTIIRLKFETPDEMKISGIEYYKAVIQDGIRDFESFIQWRAAHPFSGIIEW